MTLTDFLLARIAEDEAAWSGGLDLATRPDFARLSRHMLTECEAKRRIVGAHTPVDEEPDGWCNLCDGDGWPCVTMAALAAVYADHPDYREEWRP